MLGNIFYIYFIIYYFSIKDFSGKGQLNSCEYFLKSSTQRVTVPKKDVFIRIVKMKRKILICDE